MPLVLNEDQNMLKDSAKNFCSDNAPITQLRRLRDENDSLGFDKEFNFPDDTEASVQLEGLLGGSYISILPGGSDVMLLNNQEILYTQGSTSLLNLMLKFANTSD